jgi:hypothetical protein
MASYKASSIHDKLVEALKLRLTTLPVAVNTVDSNGDVVTTFSDGTPAAGEKVLVIRTKGIASAAKDSLGLAWESKTPHVVQICTETGATATNHILTAGEIGAIWFEIARSGAVCEWYRSANTTIPSTAAMTAANLAISASDLWKGPFSAS